MENGAIADAQISASSQYDRNNGPQRARLNGRGGWRPRTSNRDQWLQVDLEKYTTVSRIATQGRGSGRYGPCVTSYRLQYSDDGVNYHSYKARGQDSVKVRPVGQHYLRKVPSFLENPLLSIKQANLAIKCQIGEIDIKRFLGFFINVAPIFFPISTHKKLISVELSFSFYFVLH